MKNKKLKIAVLLGGVSAERIRMVPSGIDLAKFDDIGVGRGLRAEFGIGAGDVVVGNIAALAPHKSQADFLRAAAVIARAARSSSSRRKSGNERPDVTSIRRPITSVAML